MGYQEVSYSILLMSLLWFLQITCKSTLNPQCSTSYHLFLFIFSSTQVGSIEGRQDLEVGRRSTDRITAKRLSENA